ncbi:MAG: S-adenosylmethionine:tRNA ribosyltransferase-isomerase, partial [Prevotella sp.]|nr:S-adenosylmethionine:tRNA ribosyltransferase-isomerase [Prevotella sp.]
ENALMVFNNTRVIQARLHFRKETGALIEIFLLEPAQPADYEQVFQTSERCSWLCLVGNQKKWKEGTLTRQLEIGGEKIELRAKRKGSQGTSQLIEFEWIMSEESFPQLGESKGAPSFADLLDAIGELPIPPYLNRKTEQSDQTNYQTVYSRIKGSVAAPTAGLHFTKEVLQAIDNQGVMREEVTLHVGAGTFKPVKSETIEGHEMHSEHISVRRQTIEELIRHGGKAIAVGTTSVRTLESLYYIGRKILQNPDIAEEDLAVAQWEPNEMKNEELRMKNEKLKINNEKLKIIEENGQLSIINQRSLTEGKRSSTKVKSNYQLSIPFGRFSTGSTATTSTRSLLPRKSSSCRATSTKSSPTSSPISTNLNRRFFCSSVPSLAATGDASTSTPSTTTSAFSVTAIPRC